MSTACLALFRTRSRSLGTDLRVSRFRELLFTAKALVLVQGPKPQGGRLPPTKAQQKSDSDLYGTLRKLLGLGRRPKLS